MPGSELGSSIGGDSPAASPGGVTRRRTSRSFFALRVVAACVGFVAVWVGAFWIGAVKAGLRKAGYVGVEVFPTTTPASTAWIMIVVTAIGVVLMTGVAQRRVDGVQLFGSIWFSFWTGLILVVVSGLQFTDPTRTCRNEGCWPQGYQELLIAVPVIGTCIAMLVMSFLQKVRWRWRALIPAGVFVVLAVLQRLTWEEYVLPFLVAPPS